MSSSVGLYKQVKVLSCVSLLFVISKKSRLSPRSLQLYILASLALGICGAILISIRIRTNGPIDLQWSKSIKAGGGGGGVRRDLIQVEIIANMYLSCYKNFEENNVYVTYCFTFKRVLADFFKTTQSWGRGVMILKISTDTLKHFQNSKCRRIIHQLI